MNIKKKFDNLNITMKLMLSYAITIISSMTIVSVFYFFKATNYMDTSTIKLLTQGLVQAKNNVEYKVDLYNSFEDTLYLNNNFHRLLYYNNKDILEKISTQKDIINYLLFISGSYNDLSKVALYVNNITIPSDDNYISYVSSISGERWYKTINQNDDVMLWIFDESKLKPKEKELSLIRKLRYMPSDEIVGIVKIDLNTDKFFNELKKAAGSESGWFDIIDNNENLIYSSINNSKSKIRDDVYAKYKDKLNTDTKNRLTINIEGKRYLTLFDTIKYTGWKIIYITPESIFYSDIKNFQIIGIIVFFLCTALFLLLAWLIASQSTKDSNAIRKHEANRRREF